MMKNTKSLSYLEGPLFKLHVLILACIIAAGLDTQSLDMSNVVVHKPHEAWLQIGALALSAGLSVFKGIKQKNAARELEKNNTRPEYRIPQAVIENVGNARKIASEGLPSAVRNNYLNQLNLNTSSALRNNLLYGGRNANINGLVRTQNDALLDLNAQDAQALRNNQEVLMRANEDLAREQTAQFQYNQAGRYEENVRNLTALRRAGDENIYAGLGVGLGAVASGNVKIPGFGKVTASTAIPGGPRITPGSGVQTLNNNYQSIISSSLARRNPFMTLATPNR